MTKRKCINCLNEFEGYKISKYCKSCRPFILKEYNKNYYKNINPIKKKEYSKRNLIYYKLWFSKNKDKVKLWKEKNKEKLKEYHKKYIKEYKRKQYELNPLKMKEKRRIRFYKDYYNLTLEQVNEIKKNGCANCGYTKFLQMVSLHHKDKNPKNNNINNLIPLCFSCHLAVHKGYYTI